MNMLEKWKIWEEGRLSACRGKRGGRACVGPGRSEEMRDQEEKASIFRPGVPPALAECALEKFTF